jgi:hypothetical protein
MLTINTVDLLLKERHAHLWLVHTHGESFHGQILRTEMELIAFGQTLHLSLDLDGGMLCIILDDKDSGKRLTESKVSMTDSVVKFSLAIDHLELIIELDAAPS